MSPLCDLLYSLMFLIDRANLGPLINRTTADLIVCTAVSGYGTGAPMRRGEEEI